MRRAEPSGLAQYERSLILLQTKDGFAFRGAARFYKDCIAMVATDRVDGERPVSVGEVVVLKDNVSFFQPITQTAPVGDS